MLQFYLEQSYSSL